MRRDLDPEILALRVSAKVGGLPFQVVLTVEGRRDLLVVSRNEVTARRPGQSSSEMRELATSDYADLDPSDVLVKVHRLVRQVEVLVPKGGQYRAPWSFESWKAFAEWLGDAKEPIERFVVHFPASLYMAMKKVSKERKAAGGRGTLRALVIAAVEEHLERNS